MKKAILGLFFFAITMTALLPKANATPPGQVVIPIAVTGIGAFAGKYITAIYAIGSPGTFSTQKDQIHLRHVKFEKTLQISAGANSVTFPASPELLWDRFEIPYNLIVFVIHDGPGFMWKNSDNSTPLGQTDGDVDYELVDSLRNTQVDALGKTPSGDALIYQFQTN